MKKIINVLIAVLMIACLAVTFTACKNGCDQGEHDMQLVSVDEATCTAAKTEHYKCAHCDHTEDRTVDSAPALGHDYTGATWTANGDKHERTCVRPGCGYKDSQNHTPVTGTNGTPADCLHDGVTADTVCSVCNATIAAGTKIDALGHDFNAKIEANVSNKQDATCTEDGHMTVKCSRCEVTEQQTIKANGHTLTYDVTEDTHTEKCSKCSYVGTPTAHVNTDGKCVCGGKLFTDFAVTDYATIKSSVSASKPNSDEKFFAIGMVKSISDGYNTSVVISDTQGNELTIFWVYNEDGTVRDQSPSKTYSVGDVVVYYGYANFYKDGGQLKNGWLVQLKSEKKINMAGIIAAELVVPESVADNFTLPSFDGATIVWSVVEGGDAISISGNNATVTPSNSAELTVKVKADVTIGLDNSSKEFTITIAKAGEKTIILDFSTGDEGVSGTQGKQTFTNGVVMYNSSDCKYNTGYLMVYKDSYIANATAIPGSILKIEYFVNGAASDKTDYFVNLSKTALLSNSATGTPISHGKNGGSVTATETDGYHYFNISVSAANGQITKLVITYAVCDHAETTDVPATNASCTVAATIAHKTCNICGVMLNGENQVITTATTGEALGHNYGDLVEATEATCTTAGQVAHYHCDRCGKDFNEAKTAEIADVTISINPDAHHYDYAVDPTDATKHIGTCSYNPEHKTEAAEHTTGDWVTTDATQHWKVCSVCKAEVDRGDHDFSNGACECGKSQDAVNYTITSSVSGYTGQDTVVTAPNQGTTGVEVTFTVAVPNGYTLTSVELEIAGSKTPLTGNNGSYSLTITKDQLGTAETVSIVVTLTPNAKSWKLANSANLVAGAEAVIIYNNGDSSAIAGGYNSSNYLNNIAGAVLTNVNDQSKPFGQETAQVFILEKSGDNWLLKFKGTDNYLAYNNSGNKVKQLSDSTNTLAHWQITVGDTTTVKNVSKNTYVLQYNANAGQERFSCYTGTQKNIQMYIWC